MLIWLIFFYTSDTVCRKPYMQVNSHSVVSVIYPCRSWDISKWSTQLASNDLLVICCWWLTTISFIIKYLALLDKVYLRSLSRKINSHQQINVSEEESIRAGKQANQDEAGGFFHYYFILWNLNYFILKSSHMVPGLSVLCRCLWGRLPAGGDSGICICESIGPLMDQCFHLGT